MRWQRASACQLPQPRKRTGKANNVASSRACRARPVRSSGRRSTPLLPTASATPPMRCMRATRTQARELTIAKCLHIRLLVPAGAADLCGTPQGDEHETARGAAAGLSIEYSASQRLLLCTHPARCATRSIGTSPPPVRCSLMLSFCLLPAAGAAIRDGGPGACGCGPG